MSKVSFASPRRRGGPGVSSVVVLSAMVAAACTPKSPDYGWEFTGFEEPTPREPDFPGEGTTSNGPKPTYGPTRHLAEAPPPISGGTLLVTRANTFAIAADPDRDRVYVVDLISKTARTIDVPLRAEPGRGAEDATGNVHVVLRKTGEVLSFDPRTATVLGLRSVCRAPRGIAYEGQLGRLLVACANGDVMALPTATDGAASLVNHFYPDLRDIVVSNGRIFVSTFREVLVFEITAAGALVKNLKMLTPGIHDAMRPPRVAWRMIAPLTGSPEPLVVHQLASNEPIETSPTPRPGNGGGGGGGGYGSAPTPSPGCGDNVAPVVVSSLTRLGNTNPVRVTNGFSPLPVDIATDGQSVTMLAAGNGHTPERPQLFTYPTTFSPARQPQLDPRFRGLPEMTDCTVQVSGSASEVGQLTAIAYAGNGHLVLQSREPAQLVLWPERIIIGLVGDSREDTGHAIFHSNSSADVACASCHAEGGDDAHTWQFRAFGARRTPSLLGTLEGTAPYHWSGDMDGLGTLADMVFTSRMSGPALDGPQKGVLQQWLFALPPPQAMPSKAGVSIAHGKELFENKTVGCASCHSGARLTSSISADVGTGGVFQVPSLIGVGARAPYLHNGCAKTLYDRFGKCGSDMHGKTSQLSAADIDDLVGYLESL